MGRHETREVPDHLMAAVAMGLLTSGTVRVDPADPASVEALRLAAERVCQGLFPPKPSKGGSLGFGTLPTVD